jgi:hypothetical protein
MKADHSLSQGAFLEVLLGRGLIPGRSFIFSEKHPPKGPLYGDP